MPESTLTAMVKAGGSIPVDKLATAAAGSALSADQQQTAIGFLRGFAGSDGVLTMDELQAPLVKQHADENGWGAWLGSVVGETLDSVVPDFPGKGVLLDGLEYVSGGLISTNEEKEDASQEKKITAILAASGPISTVEDALHVLALRRRATNMREEAVAHAAIARITAEAYDAATALIEDAGGAVGFIA